jgi:hypothetical protein
MRKVILWTVVLAAVGFWHNAFACELNREASQPASATIIPGACSGSDCSVNPQQDLINEKRPDTTQDCGAYFDPSTYSGSNGLFDWLMASLDTQSQYKLGAGFAQSPMDANAQFR